MGKDQEKGNNALQKVRARSQGREKRGMGC